MGSSHAADVYNRLQPNDLQNSTSASNLVQRLIAITAQRDAKRRQDELDRIAEEERQRAIQKEDDERALKLLELSQQIAAATNRPTEKKDVQVAEAQLIPPVQTPSQVGVMPPMTPEESAAHMATGEPVMEMDLPSADELGVIPAGTPQSIPLTQKKDVRTPTPTHKLSYGGQEFDVPLFDRADIRERERQARLDTGEFLDSADPRVMAALSKLPPATQALITLNTTPDGLIKSTGLSGALTQTMRANRLIEKTIDLGDRQRVVYSDGTYEDMPKGVRPGAGGAGGGLGAIKPYTDRETGETVYLTNEEAHAWAKAGKLGPPPTAEMRNTDVQSAAVQPAFEMAVRKLDTLESELGGAGGLTQWIPGTQAARAKDQFITFAKAFQGAITARMAGEGSRLSDEDRVAYSQAAALVEPLTLGLPGGIEDARTRLKDALSLINAIQDRRRRAQGGVSRRDMDTNTPRVRDESLPAASGDDDPLKIF